MITFWLWKNDNNNFNATWKNYMNHNCSICLITLWAFDSSCVPVNSEQPWYIVHNAVVTTSIIIMIKQHLSIHYNVECRSESQFVNGPQQQPQPHRTQKHSGSQSIWIEFDNAYPIWIYMYTHITYTFFPTLSTVLPSVTCSDCCVSRPCNRQNTLVCCHKIESNIIDGVHSAHTHTPQRWILM